MVIFLYISLQERATSRSKEEDQGGETTQDFGIRREFFVLFIITDKGRTEVS